MSGRSITLLGFGSQGRTWAENLRDGGYCVEVALPNFSETHLDVWQLGFISHPIADLPRLWRNTSSPITVALLFPDQFHGQFWNLWQNYLPQQSTVVVAHGLSLHFGRPNIRPDLDVILVSPKAIGPKLRTNFLQNQPTTFATAVWQNPSGKAWEKAERIAYQLGGVETEIVPSTVREECLINLFVEQALLCGGLAGIMLHTFEILVEKGLNPRLVRAEVFDETVFMTEIIRTKGISGMLSNASTIARLGAEKALDQVFNTDFRQKFLHLFNEIQNGNFYQSLVKRMPVEKNL